MLHKHLLVYHVCIDLYGFGHTLLGYVDALDFGTSAPFALDLAKLDALVESDAVSGFLDVDTWVRLEDLLATIPLEIYNSESFLKKNRFVSFEKDNLIYMVRFEEYLMEKSVSPIEIERDRIKSVLLLQRKKELLSRLNVELYEKAEKEKVFEIY